MDLTRLKDLATSKVIRQGLKFKKNSPHIMFGVGVVGFVGTVVLASKATMKLPDILDEHDSNVATFKAALAEPSIEYTAPEAASDIRKSHVLAAIEVTKVYAPAAVVGVVSVACLTGAHVELTRRNTALMAAYAAIDKGFREYRKRVVNDLGVEKDREYLYGKEEIEVEVEGKGGKKKVKKVEVAQTAAIYAKFFDESNENWSVTPENNLSFLKMHQNYQQLELQRRGHVFLNEVYDAVGLPRTPEGSVVGWLRDGDGDGFIDFGIWDDDQMADMQEFLSGRRKMLLLNFNVDGVIYDKI